MTLAHNSRVWRWTRLGRTGRWWWTSWRLWLGRGWCPLYSSVVSWCPGVAPASSTWPPLVSYQIFWANAVMETLVVNNLTSTASTSQQRVLPEIVIMYFIFILFSRNLISIINAQKCYRKLFAFCNPFLVNFKFTDKRPWFCWRSVIKNWSPTAWLRLESVPGAPWDSRERNIQRCIKIFWIL